MKFLIAGLGNIGPEYELTRHNAGFLVLDQLADQHNVKFSVDRLAEKAEFRFKGKTIHLIKPTTYMNLSGNAVREAASWYKVARTDILVVLADRLDRIPTRCACVIELTGVATARLHRTTDAGAAGWRLKPITASPTTSPS